MDQLQHCIPIGRELDRISFPLLAGDEVLPPAGLANPGSLPAAGEVEEGEDTGPVLPPPDPKDPVVPGVQRPEVGVAVKGGRAAASRFQTEQAVENLLFDGAGDAALFRLLPIEISPVDKPAVGRLVGVQMVGVVVFLGDFVPGVKV